MAGIFAESLVVALAISMAVVLALSLVDALWSMIRWVFRRNKVVVIRVEPVGGSGEFEALYIPAEGGWPAVQLELALPGGGVPPGGDDVEYR